MLAKTGRGGRVQKKRRSKALSYPLLPTPYTLSKVEA
jgi:hypothetical protein